MRSARRTTWATAFVTTVAASVLTLGGAALANPAVPEIGPGSANEAGVRCVQQAHNTVSGAGLEVDGQYGPATTEATKNFQRFVGLADDGKVGPRTGGTLGYFYDLTVGAGAWQSSGCWDVVPSDEGEPPPGGAYALPLPGDAVTRGEYGQAHWDGEPEIDLIVPEGTPVYAMTAGRAWAHDDPSCGTHVHLDGDDGGAYIFCHMSSTAVGDQQVGAGELIGYSGDTGESGAPHLHVQLDYPSGTKRCPQPMLLAIYDGAAVPGPGDLPTSNCAR